MDLLKKSLVCLFLSSVFVLPTAYAEDDPCIEIAGSWKGILTGPSCVFQAEADGTRYKDIVRLTGKLYGSPEQLLCHDQPLTFEGTCKEGQVHMNGMVGYVFGGVITLKKEGGWILILKKLTT